MVIAGGGPSGLLASILLNNIGVSSTVVERAKQPDEWSSKSYTLVLGDKGKSSLERGVDVFNPQLRLELNESLYTSLMGRMAT